MEGILPFRPKQQQSQVENDNPLSLYPMSGAPVDGFEGFAVNRIKLKYVSRRYFGGNEIF